jgi:hypothetical protein
MKIVKNLIVILALVNIIFSTVKAVEPQSQLRKNQVLAFPNTYEAPINSTNLQVGISTPLLSSSLNEADPKGKMRISEFLEIFRYSFYKLTSGEAEQIFYFADRNKDDQIDQQEWDDFKNLYILPFEACTGEAKYIMTADVFTKCFNADPRTKVIEFRRRYKNNGPLKIVDTIEHLGSSTINFHDYLFFRRALYGWSECHSSSKYIAKSSFKCAILSIIPQKYNLKIDFDRYYDAGLKLASDRNLLNLDFISFIRISYYTYYFVIFGQPLKTPYLEKGQFIRAVHEDRLPINFDENEIKLIYSLTNDENSMDFNTFAFFFHYKRLFNKYSLNRPLLLSQGELLNLLRDETAPKELLLAIDSSYTNFSQAQYLEASLVLQKKRLNEKTFFSFMQQDASVRTNATEIGSTINSDFITLTENIENRKVFFNIMVGLSKEFWTKTDFYRAFIIGNLYVSLRDTAVSHNVGILLNSLQTQYDQVTPTINQEIRKNYILYKSLPSDVDLDLLSFLALENFTYKIENHKFNAASTIEETLLKAILKDNGMKNIPDTVIDLAKTGYDTIRRRIFNALEVVKYILITHSAAVERARTNDNYKKYKLSPNQDNSRLYPDPHRKFLSSPLV